LIKVNHDLFRQIFTESTINPQKHALTQQIDKWERESVNKFDKQQKKQDKYYSNIPLDIEIELNKLTDQLKQNRQENDFYETDLRHWNEELSRLTQKPNKPSNIKLQQESKLLVTKISINVTSDKYVRHT